jgi:hypothetical protein
MQSPVVDAVRRHQLHEGLDLLVMLLLRISSGIIRIRIPAYRERPGNRPSNRTACVFRGPGPAYAYLERPAFHKQILILRKLPQIVSMLPVPA